MGINLWVDDLRNPAEFCPVEKWHWAKTVTEAIRILATQRVDKVSLDHDIMHAIPRQMTIPPGIKADVEAITMMTNACSELHIPLACPETFEAVAWFIAVLPEYMKPKAIYIHTANGVGAQVMATILGGPSDKVRIVQAIIP